MAHCSAMIEAINKNTLAKADAYSDAFLLDHLKELTKQLGRNIGKHDINKAGKVSYKTYHKRFGNLLLARKAAGLVKSIVQGKYTDKDLLDHLKIIAAQLNRTPGTNDINQTGVIKSTLYTQRFGSLKKAWELAGLEAVVRYRVYTKKELLDHLKALAKKLGKIPSTTDIINAGAPGPHLYFKRFGTIRKARKAAGLTVSASELKYTKGRLIHRLQKLTFQLGRIPDSKDINKAGPPFYSSYRKHFGSIKKTWHAAGLDTATYKPRYSDLELIAHLQALAKQLGRTPNSVDINEAGQPSYLHYRACFGSIRKAHQAAGFDLCVRYNTKYTEKELINHLKTLAEDLGRTPNYTDIIQSGKIPYRFYYACFGSLVKAQQAVGFDPATYRSELMKEKLIRHLKELAEKLGRTPNPADIDCADNHLSYNSYLYHFRSLRKAQEAAGLEPSKK